MIDRVVPKSVENLRSMTCGDSGCIIVPPRGVTTNGGCRCESRVLRLAMLAWKRELEQALIREHDLRDELEQAVIERDGLLIMMESADADPSQHALRQLRSNIGAPLPWRVERDWTYEVTAADGTIVDKLPTREAAQAMCVAVNDRTVLEPQELCDDDLHDDIDDTHPVM